LDSVYGQIVHGIATDRKLDEATVRALVNRGPLLTQEALDAHLIDHVGYSDEALAALGVAPDGDKHPLPLLRYLAAVGHPHQSGPTIALIYASGLISRGGSADNPLTGSATLGADAVIRAFRLAERDPAVRAILFRIDSPGGSAVASEAIWRETVRAQEKGKKIIVSMGNVAGSGGYYIAAAADKIVAQPATITGSIGVVAGKMLFNGLLDKVGAGVSAVQIGDDAGLFSPVEDFTPQGSQRLEAELDDVYGVFKDRVARGRKLDPAAVETIAKGRIWSGEDAKAKGLVDALGGYGTALALAKQAAGVAADGNVTIKLYPPTQDAKQMLIARILGRDSGDEDDDTMVGKMLVQLRPLIAEFELLAAQPSALLMAPVELR
jgi:protease-4